VLQSLYLEPWESLILSVGRTHGSRDVLAMHHPRGDSLLADGARDMVAAASSEEGNDVLDVRSFGDYDCGAHGRYRTRS
jgi:hypothetical protein